MKIRKVFESMTDLYQKVDYFDFGVINGRGAKELSPEQMDVIIKTFSGFRRPNLVEIKKYNLVRKIITSDDRNKLIYIPHNIDISIYVDNDEWYYLRIANPELRNLLFYKCDQWDGLIECIKNEVIKNEDQENK